VEKSISTTFGRPAGNASGMRLRFKITCWDRAGGSVIYAHEKKYFFHWLILSKNALFCNDPLKKMAVRGKKSPQCR
jgi:hypothetical protein